MARPDVLVLGGGIAGLTCARELAKAGLRVEIFEKGRAGKVPSASWASGGMLAPLFESTQPGAFFEICREGRDLWRDWANELIEASRHDIGLDTSGTLAVGPPGSPELRDLRRAALDLGEVAEPVDDTQLREWIPGLGPQETAGLRLPGEQRVDNRKVLMALAAVLEEEGVPLHQGHEVLQVDIRNDEVVVRGKSFTRSANWILVAAGAASATIPGLLPIPVHPVRGQILELEDVEWTWRGSVRWGEAYAVARGRDRLLVGSTLERGDLLPTATPGGLHEILGHLLEQFPGLAGHPVRSTWAGLRPCTPDERPLIGPDPREPRIWWATGHYRAGILLAPWTARKIAAACTEDTEIPAEVSVARLDLGE